MENQSILTSRARRHEGVVFTPDYHAEKMLQEALYYRLGVDIPGLDRKTFDDFFKGNSKKKIGRQFSRLIISYNYQDPAVGMGIFLKSLIRNIKRLVYIYGLNLPEKWEQNHISGWDINLKMIEYCALEFQSNLELIHGDYLDLPVNSLVDIILANPPYVRQELLNRSYKKQILRNSSDDWPNLTISARSDLYVYFVLKAAKYLKKNGVLTFIIPNSWMDNNYGKVLRELFKSRLQLNSVLESERRHFNEAVNTVIITATKKEPVPDFPIYISTNTNSVRIDHKSLESLQLGWYGSLFRCPDWLLKEIQTNDRLAPLGDRFAVSTGIITGDNQQYYSSARRSGSTRAIRSPKEVKTIKFQKKDSKSWIQTQNIPFTLRKTPLLWVDLRGNRHFIAWNRDNLPFEHTFYGLSPKQGDIKKWALVLNSSWVWLMVEIFGRKGLGGGAVRLVKKDLVKLPIPDLNELDFPGDFTGFLNRPIESWRTELIKPDRRKLDVILFKFLNIHTRYEECMELLFSLMEGRERKAKQKKDCNY